MIMGAEKQKEMIMKDPSLAKYLKKHNVRGSAIQQPKDSSESRQSLNVSTVSNKTQVFTSSTGKSQQLGSLKNYEPQSAKKSAASKKKVVRS